MLFRSVSTPATTDPKLIIDTEVNMDFAIGNDDLFGSKEENGDGGGGIGKRRFNVDVFANTNAKLFVF